MNNLGNGLGSSHDHLKSAYTIYRAIYWDTYNKILAKGLQADSKGKEWEELNSVNDYCIEFQVDQSCDSSNLNRYTDFGSKPLVFRICFLILVTN